MLVIMTGWLKAVIFDFDGLMVDTETPAYAAWSSIYIEHGVSLSLHDWVLCVGTDGGFDPVQHLQTLLGRELDRMALFAEKERRKSLVCQRLGPRPGLLAKLDEAAQLGLPLAVASSSAADWVVPHLERLHLRPRFAAVVTRDDVKRVKPFPDLYLRAAAQLQLTPSQVLVFEDSEPGVRAARAAGMRCIAVPGPITRHLAFVEASARTSFLGELSLAAWAARLALPHEAKTS